MATWEGPKQKFTDGLWHYCRQYRGAIYPIGNCAQDQICPKCFEGDAWVKPPKEGDCDVCGGKRLMPKENPCSGHATAHEACVHQQQYLVESAKLQDWVQEDNTKVVHICVADACPWPASKIFSMGMNQYVFCDEHATKENLAKLVPVPGQSWSY